MNRLAKFRNRQRRPNPAVDSDDDEPMQGRGTSTKSLSSSGNKGGGGRFDRQPHPYGGPSGHQQQHNTQRSSSLNKKQHQHSSSSSSQHNDNTNKKRTNKSSSTSSKVSWVSGRTFETEAETDYPEDQEISNTTSSEEEGEGEFHSSSEELNENEYTTSYASTIHDESTSIGLGSSEASSSRMRVDNNGASQQQNGESHRDNEEEDSYYSEESGVIFSSDQSKYSSSKGGGGGKKSSSRNNKYYNTDDEASYPSVGCDVHQNAAKIIRGGGKNKSKNNKPPPPANRKGSDGMTSLTSSAAGTSSSASTGEVGSRRVKNSTNHNNNGGKQRSNSNPSPHVSSSSSSRGKRAMNNKGGGSKSVSGGNTVSTNTSHGNRTHQTANIPLVSNSNSNSLIHDDNEESMKLKPPSIKGMPSTTSNSIAVSTKKLQHRRSQSSGVSDDLGASSVSSPMYQSTYSNNSDAGGYASDTNKSVRSERSNVSEAEEAAAMQQLAFLVVSLRAELKDANDIKDELEAKLANVTKMNGGGSSSSTAAAGLQSESTKIKQLQQENSDLQADLDAFIAEQDELQTQIHELTTEKSSLNDIISRLKKDARGDPNSIRDNALNSSFGNNSSQRSLNGAKTMDEMTERIQELSDENHKLEKEIQLLVGEKSQLVTKDNERVDELDALHKEIKEIVSKHTQEMDEKEKVITSMEEKITSLEESYDVLEKECSESKMTIAVMEDELAQKSEELDNVHDEHAKAIDGEVKKTTLLRQRLGQVEKQKAELQELNENLNNAKSSLQDELDELLQEHHAMNQEMEDIKSDNDRLSNELKVQYSKNVAQNATAEVDALSNLEKMVATLEKTKSSLETELKNKDIELIANSTKMSQLEERLQAQQDQGAKILDLETKLRVQEELSSFHSNVCESKSTPEERGESAFLKNRLTTLATENEGMKSKLQELQSQLTELENVKNNSVKTLTHLETSLQSKEEGYEQLKATKSNLESQNQVTLDTITNLQKMIASLEGTNAELEDEMNEATDAIAMLEDELDQKDDQVKELLTKLTKLQQEFSQVDKCKSALAERNALLASANDDLNTQIKIITIEKKVAYEEVETLKTMRIVADEDEEDALFCKQEQKQEVDMLEEKLEAMRTKNSEQISRLEQEVYNLEESKRKLEKDLDESSDAITVLREALTEMEESKAVSDAKIKELKASLKEKDMSQREHQVNVDTIATLQKMITSLEESKEDLEEELNASSIQLHDLKEQLKNKNTLAEVTMLENKLTKATDENKALTKRIKELSEANDKMKVEVKDLGESLASLEGTRRRKSQDNINSSLSGEPDLASCDALISELKSQIKQIVSSRNAALHEIEMLRSDASVASSPSEGGTMPPPGPAEVKPATASVAPAEKTKKTASESTEGDCDKTYKTTEKSIAAHSSTPSNAGSRGSSLLEAAKKLCNQLDEKKSKEGSEKSSGSKSPSPVTSKKVIDKSKVMAAPRLEEEDAIKNIVEQDDDIPSVAKETKEVDKTPADDKLKSSTVPLSPKEDENRRSTSSKPKLDIDQLTSIYFEKCGMSVSRFSDLSSDSSSFRRRSAKAPSDTVTKKVKICRNGVFMGTYEGDLNAEGQRHGFGVLLCDNGNSYEGEWKKDKRDGLGIARYSSGDVYDGQWQRGKRQGHGVMYIEAGDTYIGSWNNGLKHGAGTYHWADGEVDVSWYQEDRRVGEGVRWNASRTKAFQLIRGTKKEELSLDEAYVNAEKLGLNLSKFDSGGIPN